MRLIRLLLRLYSYVVHASLSIAALAMSALILASPNHRIRIGWLPWTDDQLGAWLAGIGVLGLALLVLAWAGRLRWLLPLYSLGVFYLLVNGLFFSSWHYSGISDFRQALYIAVGMLLAFVGAIP